MANNDEKSLSAINKLLVGLSTFRISLSHKIRWGGQFLSKPDMCLIGEYHGGNVGDMALAYSLKNLVGKSKRKSYLQTLHNLPVWPTYGMIPAIVGGGTVLNSASLAKLADRFGKNPERLALLGVDYGDVNDLYAHQDFLKSVAMLTFRSTKACKEVGSFLGRDNVSSHFDLAFGLKPVRAHEDTPSREGKVLGFNILPLYKKYERGSFIFDWGGDPLNRENAFNESLKYVELIRMVLMHYQKDGYELVHIPFTSEDDAFARIVLDGITVDFKPYSRSVTSTQSNFSNLDLFLATRYHSLIFALIQGVPCLPVSYSMKCNSLLEDLSINRFDPTFLPNLAKSNVAAFHCIVKEEPISLSGEQLKSMRESIESVINRACSMLFPT